jgi:hypothetical protein
MRNDIRHYSDEELSINFMNDEGLYSILQNASSFDEIKELADELFICTLDQLDNLKETWEEEQEEE